MIRFLGRVNVAAFIIMSGIFLVTDEPQFIWSMACFAAGAWGYQWAERVD